MDRYSLNSFLCSNFLLLLIFAIKIPFNSDMIIDNVHQNGRAPKESQKRLPDVKQYSVVTFLPKQAKSQFCETVI